MTTDAERFKLVIRCHAHPTYTGLGSPVRVPGGERCNTCAYVSKMRGAAIMANAMREGDDFSRPVRVRWGAW